MTGNGLIGVLATGQFGPRGTFFTTASIGYLVAWLNCAKQNGLTINYLGGWNERGYNISWYEQLRSTLNADGYTATQIVGSDDGNWNIANDLVSNSAFSQAVQIIGSHYPAMTAVEVAALIDEQARVEIEVTAVLPE